jgi:O-antigen ligase
MKFISKKEKIIFFNFPVALFCMLPFFLITGPFLSDLAISIISLIFLFYCFNKRDFSFFKKKYFYLFLLFWFYLVFNSLFNNFNFDSLKISFFYLRYGVFVIAITAFLNFNDDFKKFFFYCICGCFVTLVIDGFFQYFNGENILGFKTPDNQRVSSFFNEKQILGSYLSRLWPVFFGLFVLNFYERKWSYNLMIIIFILSETLIFLSGDRTAFFYINLSAFFILIFSKKLFKLRLATLLLSFFLIFLVSSINPTAKERIFDLSIKQFNFKKKEGESWNIFTQKHDAVYKTAYKMFLDNKLLGVGVKNFRKFCNNEDYQVNRSSCSTHPHNAYIQLLSETGLIGFCFLLIIFFYFCKFVFTHLLLKLKKKYYFIDFEICLLSGILLYLWPFVPTGSIFNNWLNIISIINLPFLLWYQNNYNINKKNEQKTFTHTVKRNKF